MNNQTILIKVKERLNKLDSSDYKNIQPWQIVEAFNKAQLNWCRRNLHGSNILKEGDEQSTSRIDDFEQLITQPLVLSFVDKGVYFQSTAASWPTNYMRYKRVSLTATNECCDKPKIMKVWLGEEGNVDIYLKDEYMKPNYNWGETFATLTDQKLNLYHDKQFSIEECALIYYRKPVPIQIIGVIDLESKVAATVEVPCEFRDDLAELLVDEAVAVLAGDIQDDFTMNREARSVETNN